MAWLSRLEAYLAEPLRFQRIAALLLVSLVFCCLLPFVEFYPAFDGERVHYLTVLGYVLPQPVMNSVLTHHGFWALLTVSAGLWLGRLALPWSAGTAVLAAIGMFSWNIDHMTYARHQPFVPTMLLVLLCAWFALDHRKISEADRNGTLWTSLLVPRWVEVLAIGYVGLTYTFSGLEKLRVSGVGWADGGSLQLWMAVMNRNETLGSLFTIPMFAQAAITILFLAEIFAVFGLLWTRSRPWFGLVLFGFHLCVELTVGMRFYGNELALLVLCVPWPGERFVDLTPATRAGGRTLPAL